MPFWRTEGPVTVGVDPYIQPDRQKEVFDDDLEKARVLPIYILVRNSGERPLSLRLSDIALELPDGSQNSPVQSETVLRMLGRWPQLPSVMSGKEVGEALYAAIGLFPLIPFAIAASVAEKKATEARIADYLNKESKDVVLGKDGSAHGFVYVMPTSTPWALKGKLVLHFVDETDGTDFVVRVPVSEQ